VINFPEAVARQVERARLMHEWPQNPSPHHAYGVIAEEFRELETELFKKSIDPVATLKELLDLAAVVQRAAEEMLAGIMQAQEAGR
jgi:hypothetical protein